MPAGARSPRSSASVTGAVALVVLVLCLALRFLSPAGGDEGGEAPGSGSVPVAGVDAEAVPALDLPPELAAAREPIVPAHPAPTNALEHALVDLAYDIDEQVRVAAAEALADWVPGEGEAGLAQAAAHDASPRVREAALRSLEGAAHTDVVSLFAHALTDADLWVQDAGESGLYRHEDRARSTIALVQLCQSDAREVRLRAAELLDEMDAGQLPWDELYEGPVGLAWAAPADPPTTDTEDH